VVGHSVVGSESGAGAGVVAALVVPDRGVEREESLSDVGADSGWDATAVAFGIELRLEGLVDSFGRLARRAKSTAPGGGLHGRTRADQRSGRRGTRIRQGDEQAARGTLVGLASVQGRRRVRRPTPRGRAGHSIRTNSSCGQRSTSIRFPHDLEIGEKYSSCQRHAALSERVLASFDVERSIVGVIGRGEALARCRVREQGRRAPSRRTSLTGR